MLGPYIYVWVCVRAHVYTNWGFPGGSVVKNPPAMQETQKRGSITGSGRSPEEGMVIHSSILVWRISWSEEPGGLQSIGSQRAGHD